MGMNSVINSTRHEIHV